MKSFFHIAFMLLSVAAIAQDKFIEVEVTDTISLKPLSFQCNIYLHDYTFPADTTAVDEEYDPTAQIVEGRKRLQELKHKLEAKKYKVGPLVSAKRSFSNSYFGGSEEGWSVTVNSEIDVKKVKEIVADEAYVKVKVLKYSDEVKAEEQLIKKLMDKAKARVIVIGSCSGLKPGKILEVREAKPTDPMSGLADLYTQLAMVGIDGQDNGTYKGSILKTYVVRFAAE